MHKKSVKGFTMLELLIVMAIIGILGSIILSVMSQSRGKGEDGAIKQNMINARAQAAFFYNGAATSTNTYGTTAQNNMCNDGTNGVYKIVRAAATAAGITPRTVYSTAQVPTFTQEACHANGDRYAIWVPLSGGTSAWCVDSTGASRMTTGLLTDGTGSYQYVCPP